MTSLIAAPTVPLRQAVLSGSAEGQIHTRATALPGSAAHVPPTGHGDPFPSARRTALSGQAGRNAGPRPFTVGIGSLLVLALVAGICLVVAGRRRPEAVNGLRVAWPADGQAAVAVSGAGVIGTSGSDRPVPIASLAKVMTAYLVLRADPISGGRSGFTMTISPEQVADTAARRRDGQSVVAVAAGERITERQALLALLLPSANNMAAALAVAVSGSQRQFVAAMNARAHRLGMRDTTYTDPSGFAPSTVSTAADQLKLARAAIAEPVLAALVDTPSAVVPFAGRIRNTDTLLGHHGFVGMKTGSDQAAGGCFMFASRQNVNGRPTLVTGVVLGQQGRSLIDAGLNASDRLVTSLRPSLAHLATS